MGQGLSILIETQNHRLLYDTGARYRSGFSAAESAILPYLYSQGIRQLDKLILSHNDNDHAGGRHLIEQALKVDQVWAGEPQHAADIGCRAGQSWRWGGVNFRVLYPAVDVQLSPVGAHELDANDQSCVLLLGNAHHRLLLVGDISASVEQRLIRLYGPDLMATTLQVAHHGSHSSSSRPFIAEVGPARAWISSARRNRFGHPHPEVLKRFSDAQIEVYNSADLGLLTWQVEPEGEQHFESAGVIAPRYWRHSSFGQR